MMVQAIPTTYKKMRFRSKLESKWAEWLDEHKIEWTYEPQGFNLENGTWYLPDFYLPEINTIIEVKGILEHLEKPFRMMHLILKNEGEEHWPDNGKTMFLLGGPVGKFYNIHEMYSYGLHVHKCPDCGKISIVTEMGSYACRSCGNHNGDFGIIENIPVLDKPLKWLLLERD